MNNQYMQSENTFEKFKTKKTHKKKPDQKRVARKVKHLQRWQ